METEVIGVYWGWKPLGYEEKIFSQQVKGGNSALARVKDGSIRKCLRVSHVSRAKVKVHTALIDDAVRRHAFVGLTRGSRLPCQNTHRGSSDSTAHGRRTECVVAVACALCYRAGSS